MIEEIVETELLADEPPELGLPEHALALAVALAVAYAAGMLAGRAVAPPGSPYAGASGLGWWAFICVRHGVVQALMVVLVSALFRARQHVVLVASAALLASAAGSFVASLMDWVASNSPQVIPGAPSYMHQDFPTFLEFQIKLYFRPDYCIARLASASGLFLAARFRGRWFEGLALTAIPSTVGALTRALASGSHQDVLRGSYVVQMVTGAALVALLVPVCELAVARAFVKSGIRDAGG